MAFCCRCSSPVVPMTIAAPSSTQARKFASVTVGSVKSMATCAACRPWLRSSVSGTPAERPPASSPASRPSCASPVSVTAPTSVRSSASRMQLSTARPMRPAAPRTATFNNGLCPHSLEEFFHAVEPGTRSRAVPLALALDGRIENAELFLLLGRQVHGRLDLHAAEQVADAALADGAYSFPPQAEQTPRLSFRRHLENDGAVERRHVDAAAERGRREADGNLAAQVLTFASEDRMRLNGDVDVEVARRPAVAPGLAFASEPDPVAIVDAGRNLDRERLVLAHAAPAAALAARLVDRCARAAAARARLLNREKALGHAELSDAAASLAGDRLGAGLRPLARATRALDLCGDVERDRIAGDGLLESQLEVVAQIRAAEHLVAAAAAPAAEDIAEHVAENIAERVRAAAEAAASGAVLHTRMTEAVVGRALVLVRQRFVGFLGFLELRFRLRVARIAVGMMLHREASIRLLEVGFRGVTRDAEYLVVIPLRHPRPR